MQQNQVSLTMAAVEKVTEVFTYVSLHLQVRPVVATLASCIIVKHVVSYWLARRSYKYKLQQRRNKAAKRKTAVEQQLTEESDLPADIVDKTVQELLTLLRNGSVSAVQVLHAFQRKALELTSTINCVVEPIVEAEEQASVLDASSKKTGLLHGVPISIKENFNISGYDSTAGLSVKIGLDAMEDAVAIQVLKKHGAIPFVRTNIPQTMLSYCCSNPLYGETLHPQDTSRGPGGSSGGEGAVIGGGASVVGIGTDIGGSLRVPAVFCGIYALKPTKGRMSSNGVYSLSQGNLAIQGVIGPMARDFESLLLLSRALMSPEMIDLDRLLPDLPFNMQEFEKSTPLRIGFYTYDGVCQCQPPVVRAVLKAKSALEKMGHEVVLFDFPSIPSCQFDNGEFFIRLMVADRGDRLRKLLVDDDFELALQPILKLGRLPRKLIQFLAFLVRLKDKAASTVIGAGQGYSSMYEYFEEVSTFLDWQNSFMKSWLEARLDAIICPTFPSPAVTKNILPLVTACGTYCQLYNSVNYPAGVVPVTKVTQEDLDKTFDPKVFKPQSTMERFLLKSAKGSMGLPVGVQCVALPFKEELCLRVMRDLESGLRELNVNNE